MHAAWKEFADPLHSRLWWLYEESQKALLGIGNKSETKEVASFKAVVSIQDHVLTDDKGEILKVDMEEEQDIDDFEEYTPKSSPSGKHVHLRIIDTPGLDDSDTVNEEKTTKGDANSSANTRKVDEMHKLAILQALAEAGEIHSVCFVLSLDSTLGAATQELLGDYLSIFRLYKLDGYYNFANTKVGSERLFGERALRRPAAVQGLFHLDAKNIKHHSFE